MRVRRASVAERRCRAYLWCSRDPSQVALASRHPRSINSWDSPAWEPPNPLLPRRPSNGPFPHPCQQPAFPPPSPVQVARGEQQPQRPGQARLQPEVVPGGVEGGHLYVGVGASRGLDAQGARAVVQTEQPQQGVRGGAALGGRGLRWSGGRSVEWLLSLLIGWLVVVAKGGVIRAAPFCG
jgi:hypothetical protein